MGEKVKLAIFDKDLKVRKYGKYEVSESGDSVKVVTGGSEHFQPKISNQTFLEFSRRSFIPPFKRVWERVYFASNKAPKCVNFATEEVPGPDREQMKKAVAGTMLGQIGREKQDMTWWNWAVLVFSFLSFLILLGTSGVLR